MRYCLRPRESAPITGLSGVAVRLHDDARKSVVFLGFRTTDDAGVSVPRYGGTGFFVSCPAPGAPNLQFSYLVTARHVAEGLAGGPFVIGVNDADTAKTDLLDIDKATWIFHPDPDVDIAALQMTIEGGEWLPFPIEGFADNEFSALFERFGCGDLVYIVGLYRLFSGVQRISPIVHTGHVAMTPEDEIPIKNRVTGKSGKTRGYLIEAQTLEGLSGAPVFVRYTNPTGMMTGGGRVVAYTDSVYLLGLWQGAWDGMTGDVLKQQLGRDARVPAGMGITIPAKRIREILELPEVEKERERLTNEFLAKAAANMDSAALTAPLTNEAEAVNPDHLEDFTRLVSAASKRKPKGDRT